MTDAYHCPSKSEHTKHLFSPPSCTLQRHGPCAPDARILESFHMKCQRQILSIRWQDHVRNIEVTNQTGLPPVMEHVVKRRNSIFGHIPRMPHTVPAHQALHCQVELSLGRLPDSLWKHSPGRPNKQRLDQIRDNNRPPADVWRDAVRRGHSGATQRSTPT